MPPHRLNSPSASVNFRLALTGGPDQPRACRLFNVERQCFRRDTSSRAGPEVEFPSSMNVHYSELVSDVRLRQRMAQATRCRGDLAPIVARDYLMQELARSRPRHRVRN